MAPGAGGRRRPRTRRPFFALPRSRRRASVHAPPPPPSRCGRSLRRRRRPSPRAQAAPAAPVPQPRSTTVRGARTPRASAAHDRAHQEEVRRPVEKGEGGPLAAPVEGGAAARASPRRSTYRDDSACSALRTSRNSSVSRCRFWSAAYQAGKGSVTPFRHQRERREVRVAVVVVLVLGALQESDHPIGDGVITTSQPTLAGSCVIITATTCVAAARCPRKASGIEDQRVDRLADDGRADRAHPEEPARGRGSSSWRARTSSRTRRRSRRPARRATMRGVLPKTVSKAAWFGQPRRRRQGEDDRSS